MEIIKPPVRFDKGILLNSKERPTDILKQTSDGKVELPLRLTEAQERKLNQVLKATGRNIDDYSEEAIEEYMEKISAYDLTSLDGLYKLWEIPDNDRLRSFQLLNKYLNRQKQTALEDLEVGTREQIEYAQRSLEVHSYIIEPVLKDIKLFELDEEIVPILKLHDIDEGQLPFPSMGIDCEVWLHVQNEDRLYFSFIIGSYILPEENLHYRGVTTIFARRDEQGELSLVRDFFMLEKECSRKVFGSPYERYNVLRRFIFAFLNYINSPEVIIKETPFNPKNNQRRIERGRFPLPPSSKIYIHGTQLRKYVDEVNKGVREFGYSCRFWVRGHYVHYKNKRVYRALYTLTPEELAKEGYEIENDVIRRFVKSFIKGSGLLIDKTYKVEK